MHDEKAPPGEPATGRFVGQVRSEIVGVERRSMRIVDEGESVVFGLQRIPERVDKHFLDGEEVETRTCNSHYLTFGLMAAGAAPGLACLWSVRND